MHFIATLFKSNKLYQIERDISLPFYCHFVRAYWTQILTAVRTIHKERIVHGDLKPQNFVLVNNVLKLIDFGASRQMPKNENVIFVYDKVIGTPDYMGPEGFIKGDQGVKIGTVRNVL
jgi:serine/threonine protein kinase